MWPNLQESEKQKTLPEGNLNRNLSEEDLYELFG